MKKFAQNEPVVTVGAVVGAIMAVLYALIQLNVFQMDEAQLAAVQDALLQVLGLVFIVAPITIAMIQRQFVTPVKKLES